jgi:hypothetical protein
LLTRGRFLGLTTVAVTEAALGRVGGAAAAAGGPYRSASSLSPPVVTISRREAGAATTPIFLAPFSGSSQFGPMIVDGAGHLVWFRPLPKGTSAAAFAVQTYRGRPVLTWWEGKELGGWGEGVYVIADSSYSELARIPAQDGQWGDLHEFHITSRDTALISVYRSTTLDLTAVGGPTQGLVMEGVVQEIDIATHKLLFEWRSSDHVPVTESYRGYPTNTDPDLFDYFHLNSVAVDTDGNLLIPARHTSTVYKLNRKTGDVMWRLGGKASDFELGAGARFWFQHDARPHAKNALTIFDDGSYGGPQPPEAVSRFLRLQLDPVRKTANVVQSLHQPAGLLATKLGSAQVLPDGGSFVSWGDVPSLTEFAAHGGLLFELDLPAGTTTYRAMRSAWAGKPATQPSLAASSDRDGAVAVHASWNGATEVTHWVVLGGANGSKLARVAHAARTGFETAIRLARPPAVVAVEAHDRDGRTLGTSQSVRLSA